MPCAWSKFPDSPCGKKKGIDGHVGETLKIAGSMNLI
jgi:hypothetical protein